MAYGGFPRFSALDTAKSGLRDHLSNRIKAAKIRTSSVASRNASICKGKGLQMRKVGFEGLMFNFLQR